MITKITIQFPQPISREFAQTLKDDPYFKAKSDQYIDLFDTLTENYSEDMERINIFMRYLKDEPRYRDCEQWELVHLMEKCFAKTPSCKNYSKKRRVYNFSFLYVTEEDQ